MSLNFLKSLVFCGFFLVSFVAPLNVSNVTTYESFSPGESITYAIYYNLNFIWVPAGEVVFNVKDEGKCYHLSARGRSYSSYDWFFKVRDNYDTYVDKTTMLPIVSIRDVNEGSYKLYDKVVYDQQNNRAVSLRGPTASVAAKKTFEVKDAIHDVLSIIYYTRNIDYTKTEKGQDIPIKIFLDQEVYPLSVKYSGTETKKIKELGNFNTIHLVPQVIKGSVFKENDKMKIWASNDANHIPLLIESPVSVGSVKVVLKEYKGLKYALDSKLK
jgi:hypothetical protein